jgi:alpha-N-acetylglucosaminidase
LGLVQSVELGRLVISDMRCEVNNGTGAEWKSGGNFSWYGAPFVWGTLHNFGGVLGMWGSLPELNSDPLDAFMNAESIAGIGMFPEGINQNPVYYSFLFDTNWLSASSASRSSRSVSTTLFDLDHWYDRYAIERYGYGPHSDAARAAWNELASSVYAANQGEHPPWGGGNYRMSASDALTAYPYGEEPYNDGGPSLVPDWYNTTSIWEAWALMITAAEHWEQGLLPSTMNYDLVNIGREALAKLSNAVLRSLENARRVDELEVEAAKMLGLQLDADRLLCSDRGFVAGMWIQEARAWGTGDEGEERYYEWAARVQVRMPVSGLVSPINKCYVCVPVCASCSLQRGFQPVRSGRRQTLQRASVVAALLLLITGTHEAPPPSCTQQRLLSFSSDEFCVFQQ